MFAIIKSSLFAVLFTYMCKQYFIILMQFFHLFAIFSSPSLIASSNELLLCKFEEKKRVFYCMFAEMYGVTMPKIQFCNKVKKCFKFFHRNVFKKSCENFMEAVSWENEACKLHTQYPEN